MLWLGNISKSRLLVKNRENFYRATLTPSFISFEYRQVLQFSNSWDYKFVHIWDVQNKILHMIRDYISCIYMHLHYIFFSVPFHFRVAYFFHGNDKYCRSCLLNIFAGRNFFSQLNFTLSIPFSCDQDQGAISTNTLYNILSNE